MRGMSTEWVAEEAALVELERQRHDRAMRASRIIVDQSGNYWRMLLAEVEASVTRIATTPPLCDDPRGILAFGNCLDVSFEISRGYFPDLRVDYREYESSIIAKRYGEDSEVESETFKFALKGRTVCVLSKNGTTFTPGELSRYLLRPLLRIA